MLTRAQLASLADAPDLHGLAIRLRALGFPVTDTAEPSVAELELAVRRRAAAALRILARWSRGRPEVMAVLFDEEDRRSIRITSYNVCYTKLLRACRPGGPNSRW